MNTPSQQAELFRKAAETIEMCAKHGIDPKVKLDGTIFCMLGRRFDISFDRYEFPIAVIEGQLVWADTVVYNIHGTPVKGRSIHIDCKYTLTPPKRTVMVEIDIDDAVTLTSEVETIKKSLDAAKRVEDAMRKSLDNLK